MFQERETPWKVQAEQWSDPNCILKGTTVCHVELGLKRERMPVERLVKEYINLSVLG